MILINRERDFQTVILTLDGLNYASLMRVKNDATREEFVLSLGDNLSISPRYDKFSIVTSDFDALPSGYYSYFIDESETGVLIESGKMFILHAAPPAPLFSTPATNNDYLIFNK